MSSQKRKSSLERPPFSTATAQVYDSGVEGQKKLVPWKQVDHILMLSQLHSVDKETYIRNTVRDTEPSRELMAIYGLAKSFVEDMTGYDLSQVKVNDASHENRSSSDAEYTSSDNTVRLFSSFLSEEHLQSAYYRDIATATLIHELMHATGINNHQNVSLRQSGTPSIYTYSRQGLDRFDLRSKAVEGVFSGLNDPSHVTLGSFFEESFAEEGASRWREAVLGHPASAICTSSNPDIPDISYRYIIARSEYSEGAKGYSQAVGSFGAEAIRQLSLYTGVDLFQLMIDSREVSESARARREIAQTIESVEKGLYQSLRDTKYTYDSFMAAYKEVIGAIERDSHKKASIGRVASL